MPSSPMLPHPASIYGFVPGPSAIQPSRSTLAGSRAARFASTSATSSCTWHEKNFSVQVAQWVRDLVEDSKRRLLWCPGLLWCSEYGVLRPGGCSLCCGVRKLRMETPCGL